jgi:sugar O-acyltransferase (sialic acid O-acetyltransferase NeuD family)
MAKVIIYGNRQWAQLIYLYLTLDTPHEVVAFVAGQKYITEPTLLGLPVVPFENISKSYPPENHSMLVALGFKKMNQFRKERYQQAKKMGYEFITYISSRATCWPQVKFGENCIVCENSIVHPFVSIGNNVVIASGTLISHHCSIADHCFIAPGSIILGGTTIESGCFIGANSTIRESIVVGQDSLIGAGAFINKNTRPGSVFLSTPPQLVPKLSGLYLKMP